MHLESRVRDLVSGLRIGGWGLSMGLGILSGLIKSTEHRSQSPHTPFLVDSGSLNNMTASN